MIDRNANEESKLRLIAAVVTIRSKLCLLYKYQWWPDQGRGGVEDVTPPPPNLQKFLFFCSTKSENFLIPLPMLVVTSDSFYFECTSTCDIFARLASIEEKILWYKQKLVETNWRKSGLVLPLRLRVHFNVRAVFFPFI